ncbi:MAG: DUF2589 domain-containing protein [Prevotella sp.]|nr:DUF2589 domain-containing protein [Prevotella sp.]MBR3658249.1 DUF2589 domain-containing protein [Prevotella sp.]
MAISNVPANVATSAMQAIPFSSMIGGPLKACIEAQAMAAKTSWEFIKEVGLNTDEKGQKSAVMVAFSFNKGGRMTQLNVPLLTIVPIPYIAINSVDINFKANINASSSSVNEESSHTEFGGELGARTSLKFGPFSFSANLKANYSTKKDSKATEESKYSVESTIDVAVKAGQESMPAGMARVLEMLNGAVDTVDVKGELMVNSNELTTGDTLVVFYKSSDGLYDPAKVTETSGKLKFDVDGNSVKCVLKDVAAGEYTIKAGDAEVKVNVTDASKAPEGKASEKEKSE